MIVIQKIHVRLPSGTNTGRFLRLKGIEILLCCQLLIGIIVIPALCVHIVDYANRQQIQITNVEPQLYAAEQEERGGHLAFRWAKFF